MRRMKSMKKQWSMARVMAIGAFGLVAIFSFFGMMEVRSPSMPQITIPRGEGIGVQDARESTPTPASTPSAPLRLEASLPVSNPIETQKAEFAAYELRFRQDSRDDVWSASAKEQMIDAAAEPTLAKLSMPVKFSADCTAHICKTVMEFTSRAAADDWTELYPVGLGGTLGSVRTMQVEGPGNAISLLVYGARDGYSEFLRAPIMRKEIVQ